MTIAIAIANVQPREDLYQWFHDSEGLCLSRYRVTKITPAFVFTKYGSNGKAHIARLDRRKLEQDGAVRHAKTGQIFYTLRSAQRRFTESQIAEAFDGCPYLS